jgi:hypothetical protein
LKEALRSNPDGDKLATIGDFLEPVLRNWKIGHKIALDAMVAAQKIKLTNRGRITPNCARMY